MGLMLPLSLQAEELLGQGWVDWEGVDPGIHFCSQNLPIKLIREESSRRQDQRNGYGQVICSV